jgi:hypothetical protein
MKFGQWLRNLNVFATGDSLGQVHSGFSSALDEIWADLRAAFDQHRIADKTTHLTGHSLGAAQATLCAARMQVAGLASGIECLYTFGQPRLAGSGFGATFDALFRSRFFRFVNQWDIVPRIPPGYGHVGTPKRITGEGTLEFTGELAALFVATDEPAGELLESDQSQLNEEQFSLLADYVDSLPNVGEALVNQPLEDELAEEGVFDFATDHYMDSYIQEIKTLLAA